jgi:hypothetical protein
MSLNDSSRAFVLGFALAKQEMQKELDLVRDQIAADWAELRLQVAEGRRESRA